MKYIILSNGARVRVDDEDFERLSGFSWSQFGIGRAYRKELIPRELRGKKTYRTLLLHREVMEVEDARKVIFRDGDPGNCTRANLVVTEPTFQPRQRARKGGSSEYRGVGWNKSKEMWQAFLRVNGKLRHLGFFKPGPEGEVLAAHAYDDAALEQFGDLAILNFPRVGRKRPAAAAPARTEPAASAPAAEAPQPAGDGVDELFHKSPQELTAEEMERMKARFLGERYRGKLRKAG